MFFYKTICETYQVWILENFDSDRKYQIFSGKILEIPKIQNFQNVTKLIKKIIGKILKRAKKVSFYFIFLIEFSHTELKRIEKFQKKQKLRVTFRENLFPSSDQEFFYVYIQLALLRKIESFSNLKLHIT